MSPALTASPSQGAACGFDDSGLVSFTRNRLVTGSVRVRPLEVLHPPNGLQCSANTPVKPPHAFAFDPFATLNIRDMREILTKHLH